QVSGPQAERRAPDPQWSDRSRAPGGAAGAGTYSAQVERQVSGPQAASGGRRTPMRSDRSRAPRRSGGHRVTRHDSGLRVQLAHEPLALGFRHWIVWLGQSWHRVTSIRSHLARQRAPRHLARQWAPSQLV
ncbi:unnamed protein product, partial [Staurois parvus]